MKKRLLIRDDDGDLFDVPLQPILYHYYKENSKEIRRMAKQQGAGFWIQFVTSFRSFISNSGLDRSDGCECCEEAFIDMLKMLTTVDSFTQFISLIESLQALHVLLFSHYGRFVTGANVVTAHLMSGFHKPFHTFPTYSRFVGAVVVLYQRWTRAPRIRARTPQAEWIPPAHWSQKNGRGPRAYECYLYDHWGNALFRMIGVDKEVMKFFNPQKGDDSTSASLSKNHNNMGNVHATQQRKGRNRRRRNRNKNKHGGVTKPSGTLNEDGSSVQHTIAGDSNNAQSGTVGRKEKEKRETDAALATSSETESADTFQYDRLFKFSRRKMNVDSGGNDMKEAGDQESAAGEASSTVNRTTKDATLQCEKLFGFKEKGHVNGYMDSGSAANSKQKERAHPSAETELPTNTDARIRCREDDFFPIDSPLFGTGKHTDRNTSKLGESSVVNNDVKTKQREANISSPEHKQPTSCHRKTADSFRDERLFTFSRKTDEVHSGGIDLNDETDANPAVHNSKKKGAVYHPTDKQFATNRETAEETKGRDFFRYDRLFNFRTRKQNASADRDNQAGKNKTKEKDFFRYDKLFSFSTQEQNAPENADDIATTNKTEEKDFFKYDKLFNFSTQEQNAPENADDKATTNKTEEKDFFKYDTLFKFSTQKQNAPENADDKATTNKTEEKDFFRYGKLFNFSTQKQNAPENADNKSTTNQAEEKDFFRYDRLFNFSTGKQNAPDSTDDASISSDDSHQYGLEDESETLDDDVDYAAFHMFCGGLFQREPHKKKTSQPVRKYLMQKCSNCSILEKYPGMYKACRRCLVEGLQAPKVYCGEHCGRTHWRKQHHTDHRTFGNKYTTFRV